MRRGNTVRSFLFNYTDTAVTDNQKGLLNARRLAEYAYALPRTRWNVGIDQRIRQVQLLGRLSYYGGWYDYDSGFGEVFIPSGGIDQGFFDGRPSIDVEASIELRENAMLMVGAQNMLDTYPQSPHAPPRSARSTASTHPGDSAERISTRESHTPGTVDTAVSQFIRSRDGLKPILKVVKMESLSTFTSDYACLSVSGSRRSLTRPFRGP